MTRFNIILIINKLKLIKEFIFKKKIYKKRKILIKKKV